MTPDASAVAAPVVDAIVFDLDDTLIDWWGSIERCVSAFAEPVVVDALQAYCRDALWEHRPGSTDVWHRNTWALHHRRHEHWPVALPHLDADEIERLLGCFETDLWTAFFPETVPTLELLLGRWRLALLTNNQELPRESDRLGLGTWFEVAVAAPRHAQKPDPSPFLDVAARLGLEPARCAYVGDSVRTDVLGARAAGMVPVWLNRWRDAWDGRPDEVLEVTTLAELPQVLRAAVPSTDPSA